MNCGDGIVMFMVVSVVSACEGFFFAKSFPWRRYRSRAILIAEANYGGLSLWVLRVSSKPRGGELIAFCDCDLVMVLASIEVVCFVAVRGSVGYVRSTTSVQWLGS